MATIAQAIVKVVANTAPLSAGMRRASLAIQQFESSVKGANKTIAAVAFGTFTAAAIIATQQATQFGTAMTEISTLLPDGTSIDRFTTSVRSLSKEFGIDKTREARAFYQIISAGATAAADATEILRQSNILAVGGVTDVAVAADGLTSALNAYGPLALQAADATDAMFVAMKTGKTTIDELSRSVGLVAPLAAEAGVSFDELLATVSALTKGGIRTRLAFTGVRQILSSIVKPTSEARAQLEILNEGLSEVEKFKFDANAIFDAGGLTGFLEELTEATGGSTAALAQLFGGVEALVPILALTGRSADDFAAIVDEMKNKLGQSGDAVALFGNDAGFVFSRLKEESSDLFLDLGDQILKILVPAATLLINKMGGIRDSMSAAAGTAVALTKALAALALIVGAIKIGAIVIAAGGAAAAFTGLVSTIGAATAAFILANPPLALLAATLAFVAVQAGILFGRLKDQAQAAREATEAHQRFLDTVNQIGLQDGKVTEFTIGVLDLGIDKFEQQVADAKFAITELQAKIAVAQEKISQTLNIGAGRGQIRDLQREIEQNELKISEIVDARRPVQERLNALIVRQTTATAQLALAEENAQQRRAIATAEQVANARKIADAQERVANRLASRLADLSASSTAAQLLDIRKLEADYLDAFKNIGDIATAEFATLRQAALQGGAFEEINAELKQFSALLPGDEQTQGLNSVLAEFDVLRGSLGDNAALALELDAAIASLTAQLRSTEAVRLIADEQGDFNATFDRLQDLFELKPTFDAGDFARDGLVAIQSFVSSIEEEISKAEIGSTLRQQLEDSLRRFEQISPALIPAQFDFDTAVGQARRELAQGILDLDSFEEEVHAAEQIFNKLLLDLIAQTDNAAVKIQLTKALKIDTRTKKDFKDLERSIGQIGRSLIQVGNALGLISDQTADVAEGMLQIGASLPGVLAFDPASIASLIGGLASVFSALDDPVDQSIVDALHENSEALADFRADIIDLSGLFDTAGADVAAFVEGLRAAAGGYTAQFDENGNVIKSVAIAGLELAEAFRQQGLTMEQAQAIADRFNINLDALNTSVQAFARQILETPLGEIFNTTADALARLRNEADLLDLTPLQELDATRDAFLDLANLPDATESFLRSIDLTTQAGRQAFENAVIDLFKQFPELTFEDLGKLSAEQFQAMLLGMEGLVDAIDGTANEITKIAESLTNVPTIFKVALRRFESIDSIVDPSSLTRSLPSTDGSVSAAAQTSISVSEGAIVVNAQPEQDEQELAEMILEQFKGLALAQFGDTSRWNEIT